MLTPALLAVLGNDLKHWCSPLIDVLITTIMIIVAWYFMGVIAAFYAAFRGGRLFAEGFFNMIVGQAKSGLHLCPGIIGADFDPNESVLDEIVGFIFAFQGLLFQMTSGLGVLPFPFNILLLPLSVLESMLRAEGSGFA